VGSRDAWFPFEFSPFVPPPPPAPPTETKTDDPALQKKVTVTAPRRPGVLQAGAGWKAGLPTLADVAEDLHRDAGLEVIADSYIRARLPAPLGETTAVRALDAVAAEL